jgi:hypothetical protein
MLGRRVDQTSSLYRLLIVPGVLSRDPGFFV